jgi:uncharacterized protein
MRSLNLILKLTERCNLNCSYCYYFNGLDQSYKEKPALLQSHILVQIIDFLKNGINELKISHLSISFHGGEPMLMKKDKFILICQTLQDELSPLLEKLSFSIQTNGTLIDKEWIKIFEKFSIMVGISLDGTKEYHDKFRVDHKGNGSYDKVEKAITLMKEENYDFGILSVINPSNNPQILYNHLIRNLGINGLDFLWPDFTHDNLPTYPVTEYGKFVVSIFDEWKKDDDPSVQIRFLNSYLNIFLGGESFIYGIGKADIKENYLHLITIRSDGELSTTDELMSTDPKTTTFTNRNVRNTTLKEFFNLDIFSELTNAFTLSPVKCRSCLWEKCCKGGGMTNRFSKMTRFDNPSIYCDGLKMFYSKVFQYLIESGISLDIIKNRLITY